MKNTNILRLGLLSLIGFFTLSLSACFSGGNDSLLPKEQQFSYWIPKSDGQGTFYQDYADNPAAQWLNNQYWDSETGTLGSLESGKQLDISYQLPVSGSESDNFNTMIATGSYPEIIDLAYTNSSPKELYEDGVLLEITDYVEEYLPNYLAFLELHPEIKPFVSSTDDEGNVHYYSLYGLADSPITPYQGYVYRRDWIVTYGNPTDYVWDLNSDYVTENGHPKYTPLSEAVSQNDFTGWKTNDVTSFTSNFGDDETWEDNIIFPSGTTDPLYISDWEWMFNIFTDAIEAEGYNNDLSAYATTLYYLGYMQTGDLVSSFGGGGPMWYIDENEDPQFGATGDNFKTYLSTMNTWYENGWIDTQFETRASDLFFKINTAGVAQGKVGLTVSGIANLGTTIRATVINQDAKDKAMMFGASLPINDVYGDASNKFKVPDTFYSQNLLLSPVGITSEAEGKDLETLFTMINWLYSFDGGLLVSMGLSNEQYESMDFSPDVYAENGIDRAYDVVENEDGTKEYINTVAQSNELGNAIKLNRVLTSIALWGKNDVGYKRDFGYHKITEDGIGEWERYQNTGYILNYNDLFDEAGSDLYAKINTYINDSMGIQIPALIKEGLDEWETYVSKINKYGPGRVTSLYEELLN